ncbi:MAG: uroporphyrinogen decarboxylase family protein [Defluviitaleaceae bacterium]|nr:uroporphyrinogen decarboxylase family protein [Defluviitaleaceae bacterium]
MKITEKDKGILRELAKRYAEIAALPVQKERRDRARDINDLKPRRPIVWLHEIPWHEMNIGDELTLVCEDPAAREMEWHFRHNFFRWKYIQADTILENEYSIQKKFSSTGSGLNINENVIVNDEKNYIRSHYYLDQLDTLEKVEAIRTPQITAHPEDDAERLAWAREILGDILPVRLRGYAIYHAPWDRIPRYRGVLPIMNDLIENPDLLHATIKKFTANALHEMKQMEALNLYDTAIESTHCTPAYTSDLPQTEPVQLKNVWFRGMAQMFGDISPAMWDEFELQYAKPLMAECGLVYYGCCEGLAKKIPLLKTVPNLRKIGVSPWTDPESCAEQIGGNYVYAHKPNPAHVSGTFAEDAVRAEIKRIIETCRDHGCPYEFVLKDISTVTYKPANLIAWVNTVMEVIDGYY